MGGIRTILVPVDFSEHSAKALDLAIDFAKTFRAKQPLGVTPYGIVIPESFDREIREAAGRHLGEWREKAAAEGIETEAALSGLFPSIAIGDTAAQIRADLIVMGTRGLSGIKHVMLGSVAERTVRTAPCPVLTVKAPEKG
jgi:nucleotide-binding universal stress UspA family protein